MKLTPFLLNPVFFFTLFFILLALFILVLRWLGEHDKQGQKSLNNAIADKDALAQEVERLKDELEKANAEISLRNQMFEGLKGQYAELEQDLERLIQKTQETDQQMKEGSSVNPIRNLSNGVNPSP